VVRHVDGSASSSPCGILRHAQVMICHDLEFAFRLIFTFMFMLFSFACSHPCSYQIQKSESEV